MRLVGGTPAAVRAPIAPPAAEPARAPAAADGAPGAPPAAAQPAPSRTLTATVDTIRYRGEALREPTLVRSRGGVLDARLDVVMDTFGVPSQIIIDTVPVGRGTRVDTLIVRNRIGLRSWQLTAPSAGGQMVRHRPTFPGPTFRVQRGDLIRIGLYNRLPGQSGVYGNDACLPNATGPIPDVYQACFHGSNYTNIHYHGMHVTPDSTSAAVGDDVLMVIAPGDSVRYNFRIPHNQSPGTHWYHPHKHGSVAIQVANGMSGAFIVEDSMVGLDALSRRFRMREHLLAIQQIDSSVAQLGATLSDKTPPLINGQYMPVIYMAPGEVQRWRIVNENVTRTSKHFDVGFVDQAGDEPLVWDVARDGVQFAPENYSPALPDTFLHMAPGQRLDVFIKAPSTPGVHHFRARHIPGQGRWSRDPTLPADRSIDGLPAEAPLRQAGTRGARAGYGGVQVDTQALPVVLFRVVVDPRLSRRGYNRLLPPSLPQLPPFLRGDLAAARDTAVIVFTDSLKGQPTQFYLGSGVNPFMRFDDQNVFVPSDSVGRSLPMVLRQTQTWKIVNNSQHMINHPFHIHINPFQVDRVVYPQGDADPFAGLYKQLNEASARGTPIWLDVLPLPLPTAQTLVQTVDTVVVQRNGQPDTTIIQQDPVVTVDAVANTAYAIITQRYDPFEGCNDASCGKPTGELVMHCHILGHEERGMMQVL
ncbi:MAG: multicopper oxidase domain-containing protein, partial [Gemmatimonadetes bacterium]|nr:multicopper oxidase domain-containing protein [Gemmatimonadota bacterium]